MWLLDFFPILFLCFDLLESTIHIQTLSIKMYSESIFEGKKAKFNRVQITFYSYCKRKLNTCAFTFIYAYSQFLFYSECFYFYWFHILSSTNNA